MVHSFVVYIDEAGDDGIGKFRKVGESGQTHWLVLSACIVSAENDRLAPSWRDEIIKQFKKRKNRELHFVELDHNQCVFACSKISEKPIGAISIMSDKRSIMGTSYESTFRQKNHLYKYMLRYLLERVSTACERRAKKGVSGNGKAKIVFSRRGGMDYDDFRTYMGYLKSLQQERGSHFRMAWDNIDIENSIALDHSRYAGLQLVDVVASSFHRAVEPNVYGFYEHRYAQELMPIIMRNHDGRRMGYGVKVMNELHRLNLDNEQKTFFGMWE